MKLDRVLVKVVFVQWSDPDLRAAAKGQIHPTMKERREVLLWAPAPMSDDGRSAATEALGPDEQAAGWAIKEVIRLRPNNKDVLAVLDASVQPLAESEILNQPARLQFDAVKPEQEEESGEVKVIQPNTEGLPGYNAVAFDPEAEERVAALKATAMIKTGLKLIDGTPADIRDISELDLKK